MENKYEPIILECDREEYEQTLQSFFTSTSGFDTPKITIKHTFKSDELDKVRELALYLKKHRSNRGYTIYESFIDRRKKWDEYRELPENLNRNSHEVSRECYEKYGYVTNLIKIESVNENYFVEEPTEWEFTDAVFTNASRKTICDDLKTAIEIIEKFNLNYECEEGMDLDKLKKMI